MPWDGGAVIQLGTSWQTSSKGLCARNCNCNCNCNTRDLSKRAMRSTLTKDIRVASSSSFGRAEVLRTFAQANRGGPINHFRAGPWGRLGTFAQEDKWSDSFSGAGSALKGYTGYAWLLAFRADICAILCPGVFLGVRIIDISPGYTPCWYLHTKGVFINASTRVACREWSFCFVWLHNTSG